MCFQSVEHSLTGPYQICTDFRSGVAQVLFQTWVTSGAATLKTVTGPFQSDKQSAKAAMTCILVALRTRPRKYLLCCHGKVHVCHMPRIYGVSQLLTDRDEGLCLNHSGIAVVDRIGRPTTCR
jgi:hypothetical protein